MDWKTLLNSDILWVAVGFALNTLATILVARIPADGPVRKFIRALHGLLDKIDPPKAPPTALVLLLAGLALPLQGCVNTAAIHTNVQKALVIEDKVHAQVVVLQAAFESSVLWLPKEKQAEALAKLEKAEAVLQSALDAKDSALQIALEASNSTVDLAALLPPVIKAIESIIAIVAEVRGEVRAANPAMSATLFDTDLAAQLEKARALGAVK